MPRQVRVWGLRLAYKFVNRADVPTHKVVEYLRSVQREQVRELCRLLGRGFPEWTMLEPAVAEEDSALTNCQDRK
ncbi:MAG TPA: hypothetical protein VGX78_17520 [Pirellulales bacterium]|nr:hypothetical protein [Pirellulales bacterium]